MFSIFKILLSLPRWVKWGGLCAIIVAGCGGTGATYGKKIWEWLKSQVFSSNASS